MTSLDTARLNRLATQGVPCAGCGALHREFFELALDHPFSWGHAPLAGSGQTGMRIGDDFLTRDRCRVTGVHFIRASLVLPIHDSDTPLRFSIWGSVSDDDFAACQSGTPPPEAGWSSWLSNSLPTYPADKGVAASLRTGADRGPPRMVIVDDSHALYDAQNRGITLDQAFAIYRSAGHDLDPPL